MSEAQKPAWKGWTGSLMAEMKLNVHCGRQVGLLKQAATLYIASPDTH